jgi:hypothetical protein
MPASRDENSIDLGDQRADASVGCPTGRRTESPLTGSPAAAGGLGAHAVRRARAIRWTGSNVLHLSYFSNFVLLGSFLGIGLGFLRARPVRPLTVVAGAARRARRLRPRLPVQIDQTSEQILYFTASSRRGCRRGSRCR